MNKKLKKLSSIIALLVAASFVLSSCGKSASPASSPDKAAAPSANAGEKAAPSSSQTPAAAKRNTLTVATTGDARVIDPHACGDSMSSNALYPVFETLIRHDATGELVPMLATEWKQLDSKSFEFKLRQGVKFHNGEEMKASDVVFSFQRATSEKGVQVQYIMNAIDPEGCEAIDDYTVVIRTKEDFPAFLSYFPYIGCVIMSEKAYQDPAAETHPVGTGPWEFVSWEKGDKLTYKRFDEYWGEKPDFENLVIKAIPEHSSRLIELETGACDIAIGLTVNERGKVEDNPNLELKTAPTTVYTAMYMNTVKYPFTEEKFRQAIDYAINEEGIVQAIHRGAANYTPGPVVPTQKYFNDSEPHCRFDPEKAKQLLAESGVDLSGKTFVISTNENQTRIDICTIIQNQLKENLGMDVKINVMETASYWSFVETNEKELFMTGWGTVGLPDPDNNIYGPLHSSQIPANNTTGFTTPELDALLQKSRTLEDGPEREKIVKEIQQIVRDATPYVTFDNSNNNIGVQKYVKGFDAMPTSQQYYNWIKLNQ